MPEWMDGNMRLSANTLVLDGVPQHFVQTFMLPRGPLTLVIP